MSADIAVELELWEELARRCTPGGAFDFGVSLLDVLTGMSAESRTDFLRNVVERAVSAASGVRMRDGVEFNAWAVAAFPNDDAAKLRALDDFIQLRDSGLELTVDEFFKDVVGVQPEAPAEDSGPVDVEIEPEIVGPGQYSVTILPFDVARIDGWLTGTKAQPPDTGEPIYELQIPLGAGLWMTVALCGGERGPYVEAYVTDAAGMERATFPPRNEFFGEYADLVNGNPISVAVLRG